MARVAFVSGSGRGIGRAIALALAARGDTVAVGDLLEREAGETVAAIDAAGGHAVALPLDVTDSDSVATAVELTAKTLGPIEILVNNAGWDELRPFLDTDEEFWDRVIEVNFKGCLRLTKAVLPGMIERGFGRVVNIGSDAGRVGSSFESVYSGAKGAVIAFTKTLARETARTGVTANTVCPGPTQTPMLEGMAAEGGDAEKFIEALRRAVPMKRLGTPEEVAAAVAFLSSEDAGFVTGQTLSVSGGLTMA
jgi:2-hydroxycyclohexanecarboxyl-CoA dehydrogenase